ESCNRSVIAVDRDFDKAWVNLTSALIRSQQYEKAVALIENETELLRVNNKLVINLAEAHHLSGDSELAINLLEALQRQDLLSDEGAIVLAASYRAL
ncbi:MAG: hypothetical protein OEY38_24545, partial [Gammaproteobacteria bacterium]|nr:hypothetical protein [Gammaproteobacteria bacterium]